MGISREIAPADRDDLGPALGRRARDIRLLHVLSVPQTLVFFRGQPGFFARRGFEFHAVASPGKLLDEFARSEHATTHPVPIARAITPLGDTESIRQLRALMRRLRPAIVHSHTPKGGLLGMLAARLAGVPVRVYQIHGLPLVTARGATRRALILSERISCRLAHQVLCVSRSVRDVAIAAGLCPADKIKVLHNGSANGVDATGRFDSHRFTHDARRYARLERGIPEDAVVLGFIGRIVRDKGWAELVAAWSSIREEFPDSYLMIVGELDERDSVPAPSLACLKGDPRVRLRGFQASVAAEIAAMSVLVLPSYREGFPVTPLEAAAMGLPVIATRVPGCIDAVVDGETGTLIPVRDSAALTTAIRSYLSEPDLVRKHGEAGRARVLRDFNPEDVWRAVHGQYELLLRTQGLRRSHGSLAGRRSCETATLA